jgi:hypothetical protein
MRRAGVTLVFLLLGGGYWLWDSTHHDHGEAHGLPMTEAEIELAAQGPFVDDSGRPTVVTSSDCSPGEDGQGQEPNTHFRCDMTYADGTVVNRLVHVLETELIFKD